MDDRPLIDRLRTGDASAFAELVGRHQRGVYGYLRARLQHHESAERMTSDVFVRLAESRDSLDPGEPLLPRLIATAGQLLADEGRRARRRDARSWRGLCRELERQSPADPSTTVDGCFPALDTALASLEPGGRKSIELHYSANMPPAEIGAHLKRSEAAAAALLFGAWQTLQRSVDAPVEVPGAAQ